MHSYRLIALTQHAAAGKTNLQLNKLAEQPLIVNYKEKQKHGNSIM